MAEWLEAGLTIAILLFAFAGYFASAESAWRDLKAMARLALGSRPLPTVPAPEAAPVESEASVVRS
jgi:hypothetical protein